MYQFSSLISLLFSKTINKRHNLLSFFNYFHHYTSTHSSITVDPINKAILRNYFSRPLKFTTRVCESSFSMCRRCVIIDNKIVHNFVRFYSLVRSETNYQFSYFRFFVRLAQRPVFDARCSRVPDGLTELICRRFIALPNHSG